MIPVKQEFPHCPEKGINGDCFRATLASLLELPISEVPHFLHDDPPGDIWNTRISTFLGPKGLVFLEFQHWNLDNHLEQMFYTRPVYHTISDRSPRFPDDYHAVVGLNGEVYHDPHPDNTGLPKIIDRTFGFLVVADMRKFIAWIRERDTKNAFC